MHPTQIACSVANIAKSHQHSICFIWSLTCHVIDQTCSFFCLRVLHCVIYLSNVPFSDCWFSVLLFNVYFSHLPYLSKVTITGFPSWEETLINSYNLWGPLSHTLSHSHTHTHTHAWPTCLYSIRIQRLIQHTRLNTHTYTHTHFTTPSCPMLFLTHKWSKQIQRHDRQTDRQTYHYPSLSISLGVWW